MFFPQGYMNQNSGMNRGPGSSYNNMNYNQQTTAAIAKELLDTGISSLFLPFIKDGLQTCSCLMYRKKLKEKNFRF